MYIEIIKTFKVILEPDEIRIIAYTLNLLSKDDEIVQRGHLNVNLIDDLAQDFQDLLHDSQD